MNRRALAIKLRDLRKGKELTQAELANKTGVSERSIQEMEAGKGNPGLGSIESLESFFKAPLLDYSEGSVPTPQKIKQLIEADRGSLPLVEMLPVLEEFANAGPKVRATLLSILYDDLEIARPYLDRSATKAKAR